jgi:hypothetical protein
MKRSSPSFSPPAKNPDTDSFVASKRRLVSSQTAQQNRRAGESGGNSERDPNRRGEQKIAGEKGNYSQDNPDHADGKDTATNKKTGRICNQDPVVEVDSHGCLPYSEIFAPSS